MNYSWHTRDRVFVTQTDVTAVAFLLDEGKTGGMDAATIEPFVLEGRILAYDEERSLVQIRVTAIEPRRFPSLAIHSLQSGNQIPAGIHVGSEPGFRVTPHRHGLATDGDTSPCRHCTRYEEHRRRLRAGDVGASSRQACHAQAGAAQCAGGSRSGA